MREFVQLATCRHSFSCAPNPTALVAVADIDEYLVTPSKTTLAGVRACVCPRQPCARLPSCPQPCAYNPPSDLQLPACARYLAGAQRVREHYIFGTPRRVKGEGSCRGCRPTRPTYSWPYVPCAHRSTAAPPTARAATAPSPLGKRLGFASGRRHEASVGLGPTQRRQPRPTSQRESHRSTRLAGRATGIPTTPRSRGSCPAPC